MHTLLIKDEDVYPYNSRWDDTLLIQEEAVYPYNSRW